MTRATAFARPARSTPFPAAFADTAFSHDEADPDHHGFAPTQFLAIDRRPPGLRAVRVDERRDADEHDAIRWVEAREAEAVALACRLETARAAREAHAAAGAAGATSPRRPWLHRLEDALERWLPGTLGSLLQLFVCVSLSMALLSAVLPMVDRI